MGTDDLSDVADQNVIDVEPLPNQIRNEFRILIAGGVGDKDLFIFVVADPVRHPVNQPGQRLFPAAGLSDVDQGDRHHQRAAAA